MSYPLVSWNHEHPLSSQYYSRSYNPVRRGFLDEEVGYTVVVNDE